MTVPGRKRDVELFEVEAGEGLDDDVLDAPDALYPSATPRPRWTWRRVARAWPLAVIAVVVAGAYLVTDARERTAVEARHDALRGQRAFAADLELGPGRLWEVDLGVSWMQPSLVDETLLLTTDFGGVIALDVVTGVQRWRLEAEQDVRTLCGWPPDEPVSFDGAVACFEQRFAVSDDGDWSEVDSTAVQRDLLTGVVLSEQLWPEGMSRATPWRDAVLRVDSDATSTVVRLEGFDGTERWSIPFLEGPLGDDQYISVWVAGGHGIVTGRDRAVVVDFDGEVVLAETSARWGAEEEADVDVDVGGLEPPELEVWPLAGGGWTVSSWNYQPERTFVFDAAGDLAFEAEGSIEELALDDGSAGDVLLLRDNTRIELVDRASGQTRFTLDRYPDGPSYLLDEELVWSGGGRLRVIDIATGEERWSEPADGELVASDGAVVVVHEMMSGQPKLRAFDLATGVVAWTLELSSLDASRVFALADALFVLDGGKLARLGP